MASLKRSAASTAGSAAVPPPDSPAPPTQLAMLALFARAGDGATELAVESRALLLPDAADTAGADEAAGGAEAESASGFAPTAFAPKNDAIDFCDIL